MAGRRPRVSQPGRRLQTPAKHAPPVRDFRLESHPSRSMISAYGDGGRPHAQTRQPQLGASHSARSPLATEFELRARHLQLTPEMYASSRELRTWCERNRNRVYIPEWLL